MGEGAVIVLGVVGLAILYLASRSRRYGRLFAPDSFREFHERLTQALPVARGKLSPQPSVDDGTAFVTRSGLQVAVTADTSDDGLMSMHISLSQQEGVTTHAVCSRFAFFVLAMLWGQKAELTPYFTDSGVHHLDFRFQSNTIQFLDFDTAYVRYVSGYAPVPFVRKTLS